MKRLVEFPSDIGEPILVEVEDVGLGGETRRGLAPSSTTPVASSASMPDATSLKRPSDSVWG